MQPTDFNFSKILEFPPISRIRRNHGLEHATLHALADVLPNARLAGYSDFGGFWILGEVPTETLSNAVEEALSRLRAGESNLAIHPNCGTNFATAGLLAGLAGAISMLGSGRKLRDKLSRLPLTAVLATLALAVAQPVGLTVQEQVTTSGVPRTLEVVSITRNKRRNMTVHRVQTRG